MSSQTPKRLIKLHDTYFNALNAQLKCESKIIKQHELRIFIQGGGLTPGLCIPPNQKQHEEQMSDWQESGLIYSSTINKTGAQATP